MDIPLSKMLEILNEKYSQYTKKDLESLLNSMIGNNFISKKVNYLKYFDKIYLDRFTRNIGFLDYLCNIEENPYELQNKIKNAKIILLGIGGIGSHILTDMLALGINNITAVDFDRVELSNFNRQILYSEDDIGELKTVSAKKRTDSYYKNNKVKFVEKYIETEHDIKELIIDNDIVIGALDRPNDIYKNINKACVDLSIPYISNLISVNSSQMFTVIPSKSGCLECWRNTSNVHTDKKLIELEENNFLDRHRLSAPVNLVATSAGLLINELIKLIIHKGDLIGLNNLIHIPFETMIPFKKEEWHLDKNCPVCANK